MPGPLAPTLGTLLIALADAGGPCRRAKRAARARTDLDGPLPENQDAAEPRCSPGARACCGSSQATLAGTPPLDAALELGRRHGRLRHPPRPHRPRGARRAALAHLRGRRTRARARARAEEELALARTWGTPPAPSRWPGAGERVSSTGAGDGAAAAARGAAALLDGTPCAASSEARTRRSTAAPRSGAPVAAPRRAGRPRRPRWTRAHACGAKLLAERARTELLATGARPRRLAVSGTGALTPSEKRVVVLAAQGLTNRRIAQHLFVTTATVETHLRHAFRKLDVKSRTELADLLDGDREESSGSACDVAAAARHPSSAA